MAQAAPAGGVGLSHTIDAPASGHDPTRSPTDLKRSSLFSRLDDPRTRLKAALLAGGLLALGVTLEFSVLRTLGLGLTWVSLLIGLYYGTQAALESLRERRVDIDVLMVVGAILAASIGHPGEGALLLFLFTLAGALEDLAMARTKREIEALHALMPTEAIVWRGGDSGAWVEAAPESLVPGERIRVRPGQRVPTDARVIEGSSSVDQSALTGESLPRRVSVGEGLFSGTVNLDNVLVAEVLKPVSESSVQRILQLVTAAREQREPMQRTIDRLGEPYAWAVLLTSLVVVLVWWLVFGEELNSAAYTAITFLIVLSPCALIIATPTATLCAIARGARAGVLFKGGQAMERLARTSSVCFDKTGTLTFGRPSLVSLQPVGWSDAVRLLSVAAGLEADSTHPIARAVREGASRRGVAPAAVRTTHHEAGQGVLGEFEGEPVAAGSIELVNDTVPVCLRARTRELLAEVQERGQIAAVVAAGGDRGAHGAAAVMVICDEIRPGASGMVRSLHAMGIAPVRMLTGDNKVTAAHVAERLGIDRWDAELMPEDKVRLVRESKSHAGRRGSCVAFIGDGVNDAPALAAADVSIAIGSIGSDAALESADIVLLSDDLATVPWAIALARRARAILKFNLFLAMAVIVLMGLTTLVGSRFGLVVPMWVGVTAHEGGTLLVVLNALRLLWAPGVVASFRSPTLPVR